MKITRTSQATGIERTWDIDITQEQFNDWEAGTLIQWAMPNISNDEHEFIISGITPKEWDHIFDNNSIESDYLDWEDFDDEPAF